MSSSAFLSSLPASVSSLPGPSSLPLDSSLTLSSLDNHFRSTTYFSGFTLSRSDFELFFFIRSQFPDAASYASHPSFSRWVDLIQRDSHLSSHTGHSVVSLVRPAAASLIYQLNLAELRAAEQKARGPVEVKPAAAAKTAEAKDVKAQAGEEKAKEAKKEKKEEKKDDKLKAAAASKDPAVIPAVYRCDFRVGKILSASAHPSDAKCVVQKIDFGEGKERCVVSGIAEHYKPEQLAGQLVVGLLNLDIANIKGVESAGRLMVATSADGAVKELATPPNGAKIGERITFDGIDPKKSPADAAVASKNTHKIFKSLRTNDAMQVAFDDLLFNTSAGPCTVKSVKNGTVQ